MLLESVISFLIAIALGGLIGAEREMIGGAQKDGKEITFGGIRTHILLAIGGGLTAFLATTTGYEPLLLGGFFVFTIFIMLNYGYTLFVKKHVGVTTEVTGVITFLIGVLCLYDQANLAVILSIFVTIILISKHYIKTLLEKIDKKELINTLKFAVLLFVILPLLPNSVIGPMGVVNPYEIWFIIVLISGVSYVGYILSKFIGTSKGIAIAGILGGLASSTAVTSSMTQQSKKTPTLLFPFVVATVVASCMMFIRVLLWVYTYDVQLMTKVALPIIVMGIASGIALGILYIYTRNKAVHLGSNPIEPVLESPFQITPAIKFALFFVVIGFLSKIANEYFGSGGIYVVSFVSGLADVDPVTFNLARQSASGALTPDIAAQGIIIANITNTFVKMLLAKLFGGKAFGNVIFLIFSIVLALGALTVFLF